MCETFVLDVSQEPHRLVCAWVYGVDIYEVIITYHNIDCYLSLEAYTIVWSCLSSLSIMHPSNLTGINSLKLILCLRRNSVYLQRFFVLSFCVPNFLYLRHSMSSRWKFCHVGNFRRTDTLIYFHFRLLSPFEFHTLLNYN